MPLDCISYQKSGYFSKLIVDYLDQKSTLTSFYNHYPNLANFKFQMEEKRGNFPKENRTILVRELQKQYHNFEISEPTKINLEILKEEDTFTITTGHQLNLFSGPMYFLYKIISTINLCKALKETYPANNFVPIYWMATEDHDFEEINHFQINGKKISWNKESSGPVGRLSTEGLETVFELFEKEIGIGKNAEYLKKLFQESYLKNKTLADATRFLANELFKDQGLVIIDADCKPLKELFIPFAEKEIVQQHSYKEVSKTVKNLQDYTIQVNPREINLFYLEDTLRERIVFENKHYLVHNTKQTFSEKEIISELKNNPEKFSPNVILRPLYQELILPNLAYIGGGGELAYWLELKSNFDANNITFPMLVLRNSVVIATQKQIEKVDKLQLTWSDLFKNQQELFKLKTLNFSQFEIDFSPQKEILKNQFELLFALAEKTDKSFVGAVKAQEKKQIKGLENLEKRLLKAEKRKYTDQLERIFNLQNALFPNQGLQERKENFSTFYIQYGTKLQQELLKNLHPFETNFTTLVL